MSWPQLDSIFPNTIDFLMRLWSNCRIGSSQNRFCCTLNRRIFPQRCKQSFPNLWIHFLYLTSMGMWLGCWHNTFFCLFFCISQLHAPSFCRNYSFLKQYFGKGDCSVSLIKAHLQDPSVSGFTRILCRLHPFLIFFPNWGEKLAIIKGKWKNFKY